MRTFRLLTVTLTFALLAFSLPAVAPAQATAVEALGQALAEFRPLASDAELQKLLALNLELGELATRGEVVCPPATQPNEGGSDAAQLARIGREVEANPTMKPLLVRHGLTGKRWVELNFQMFSTGFALYAVDATDADARQSGRPATERTKLIDAFPIARFVATHEDELTAAGQQLAAACSGDDNGAEEPEAD